MAPGTLADEIAAACRREAEDPTTAADALSAAVPFGRLLRPIARVARGRLCRRFPPGRAGRPLPGLSDEAVAGFERALLERLSRIAGQSLYETFDVEVQTPRRTVLKLFGQAPGEAPRDAWDAFIVRHLATGWAGIFAARPELWRLIEEATMQWVDASAEFVERLNSDWPGLEDDPVVLLATGLSDPHRGGRSVIRAGFASGRAIVYKPKDVAMEATFNDFLAWCNSALGVDDFRTFAVRRQGAYGWCEYIGQAPCPDAAAVEHYYRRAGALTAILYLLRATDCHRENIVAAGDHPVLVDMETLFYAAPRLGRRAETAGIAASDLRDFLSTVVGSGLLPRWELGADGRPFDVSGLGALDGLETPARVPRIVGADTDDMLLVFERVAQAPERNVPRLGGLAVAPADHADALCEGFSGMYRMFMRERELLASSRGPLAAFRGLVGRFLVRHTREYHALLAGSFSPDVLADADGRRRSFERLFADAHQMDEASGRRIVDAEIGALARQDVPFFTTRTDATALEIEDRGLLESFFERSGFDRAMDRLALLCPEDLAFQLQIVRGCLLASRRSAPIPERTPSPFMAAAEALPGAGGYLPEAIRLGEEIVARGCRHPDGRMSWVGLGPMPAAGCQQLQPLGDNLYEGKAGIAVFLAALAQTTGRARFADAALAALKLVRTYWRTPGLAEQLAGANALGIGGLTGTASIGYALLATAQFLDDARLRDDALGTLGRIDVTAIQSDRQFDLMNGAAGAMLALLRAHAETGDADWLVRARACGEHLLEHRCEVGDGLFAWRRGDSVPALTGLSHGAAGIGMALVRLALATGDSRYLEGVRWARAFESAWFSSTAGNWQDLREIPGEGASPRFMNSWCHGATGIGLSRLEAAVRFDDEAARRDVAVAVAAAAAQDPNDVDHLCCGNFGRIALMAIAASDAEDTKRRVDALLAQRIGRAAVRGGYRLYHALDEAAWHPGFFRGTAGIGYTLLRLASGRPMPDILVLE